MNDKIVNALREVKKLGEVYFQDVARFTGILNDILPQEENSLKEHLALLIDKHNGYNKLKAAPNTKALKQESDVLVEFLRDKGLRDDIAETVVGSLAMLFTDKPLYNSSFSESTSSKSAVASGNRVLTKPDAQQFVGNVKISDAYREIEARAFAMREDIVSVELPDSVTVIGEGAFSDCINLKNVRLSKGLTNICAQTFYSCEKLSSVTLPDSITSIEKEAFVGCNGLNAVVIPSGVTHIGEQAFYSCANMESMTIPKSVYSIGSGALSECKKLVVTCKENSYAHRFCKRMYIKINIQN